MLDVHEDLAQHHRARLLYDRVTVEALMRERHVTPQSVFALAATVTTSKAWRLDNPFVAAWERRSTEPDEDEAQYRARLAEETLCALDDLLQWSFWTTYRYRRDRKVIRRYSGVAPAVAMMRLARYAQKLAESAMFYETRPGSLWAPKSLWDPPEWRPPKEEEPWPVDYGDRMYPTPIAANGPARPRGGKRRARPKFAVLIFCADGSRDCTNLGSHEAAIRWFFDERAKQCGFDLARLLENPGRGRASQAEMEERKTLRAQLAELVAGARLRGATLAAVGRVINRSAPVVSTLAEEGAPSAGAAPPLLRDELISRATPDEKDQEFEGFGGFQDEILGLGQTVDDYILPEIQGEERWQRSRTGRAEKRERHLQDSTPSRAPAENLKSKPA